MSIEGRGKSRVREGVEEGIRMKGDTCRGREIRERKRENKEVEWKRSRRKTRRLEEEEK